MTELQRWVWIIQESCDEDDCPCESPDVLRETSNPHDLIWRTHVDLVESGWFTTLDEAITYFLSWINNHVPFTAADLHCLHDPSVHDEAARVKMKLPYEPREECGHQGILLIREGTEEEADDRTFVVFERLKYMNVEELERQNAERLEHIQGFVRAKEPTP